LAAHSLRLDRAELERIVATSDKQRFAFDQTGERIRANQGHSVVRRGTGPGAGGRGRQRPGDRRTVSDRARRDDRRARRRRHLGSHRDAGLELPERPRSSDLDGRLVNVFLKCEASQDGAVRGRRNAMLDDSDVHWHRRIKAAVGGATAAVTGDPAVFVSVSAAHQGPDGGGPVAAIIDAGT